jgi:hypothetical protein
MEISKAQGDLRRAFVGGGPGVLVSALVWLTAAAVEPRQGVGTAFAVLFLGGMIIFPVSTLACRYLFKRGKEEPDNPLGRVALESTFAMIGGLFAAWLFLPARPEFVFPVAAIAVGTHYAAFRTAYGDILFWLLGGLITLVGLLGIYPVVPLPGGPILAIGVIEFIFAVILTMRATRAPEMLAPSGAAQLGREGV